jgi:hypothetical protein
MTFTHTAMDAVLLAIVVSVTALALVVDVAALIGWVRRRWR